MNDPLSHFEENLNQHLLGKIVFFLSYFEGNELIQSPLQRNKSITRNTVTIRLPDA